jgi:hypothetical protein
VTGPAVRDVRRAAHRAAVALALAGALVACTPTGSGPPAPAPPGQASPAGPTSPGTTPTTTLRLGLTEWSIETGDAVPAAGEIEVVVTNTGATAHDVVVHGTQGTWGTPVLEPGESHRLDITTTAGEVLELVCSVAGHHSAGMRTDLQVAEGS